MRSRNRHIWKAASPRSRVDIFCNSSSFRLRIMRASQECGIEAVPGTVQATTADGSSSSRNFTFVGTTAPGDLYRLCWCIGMDPYTGCILLSHFRVDNVTEPIEPLTGIARHPFARVGCGGGVNIFDIRYLIPHNNCGAAMKPRVLLFDIGASVGFKRKFTL